MAQPEAPVGWPAAVLEQLDAGVPLEQHADYREMLDLQAAAPPGQLHPSVAALNAGVAAPAARVMQLADGAPQQLPDIIESCFAPMMNLRRSVVVFEPRGQTPAERKARKRRRGGNGQADGATYSGNAYPGR